MTKPLTNAERQRRHKQASPRPRMSAYVSRWVQAAVDAAAEHRGVVLSDVVEDALKVTCCVSSGSRAEQGMRLTERGAKVLGHCTACKRKFSAGERVRRDGEFARHEVCK